MLFVHPRFLFVFGRAYRLIVEGRGWGHFEIQDFSDFWESRKFSIAPWHISEFSNLDDWGDGSPLTWVNWFNLVVIQNVTALKKLYLKEGFYNPQTKSSLST